MDFKSILLAQKTGYIPRNHFDALFARKTGGAVLKDFPGLPASIVTVTDALAKPLDSLKVAITPVQEGSGDPSPDNIRPISGWTECNIWRTGKNLCSVNTIENVGWAVSNKGIKSCLNALSIGTYYLSTKVVINTIVESGSGLVGYYITNSKSNPMDIRTYPREPVAGASYNILRRFTITEEMVGNFTNVYLYSFGSNGVIKGNTDFTEIQLEVGDTATSYEPYTGQDYTITFPSEAGTVYGGTLDVVNGVLTVTHIKIDLGILSWAFVGNYGSATNVFRAYSSGKPTPTSQIANAWCEVYKVVSNDNLYSGSNKSISITTSGSYVIIRINDTTYSGEELTDFTNFVTGKYLLKELATPITYQLTPTEVQMLLGTNNIWADTGDILEGKYYGKRSSATRAMLNTLRDAGEITRITPEEPKEPEEPEENDER